MKSKVQSVERKGQTDMQKIKLKLPGADNFYVQEAYKVLRTNLQFCGQNVKVIALTSCNENEGKTTISLHLARSLAELGKKVIIIDGDMRKSILVGRNTYATKVFGLSEALTGMKEVSECIYATQYLNLNIMFAGKCPPNPVELLNSDYFSRLIEHIRGDYDYIIIDTPPLGRVIDAAVIAPNCDGIILVLGSKHIHRKQAQDVIEQINKSGKKVLGVVRNNIKRIGSGYYYRDKRYGK